jgi:hypothetical protein
VVVAFHERIHGCAVAVLCELRARALDRYGGVIAALKRNKIIVVTHFVDGGVGIDYMHTDLTTKSPDALLHRIFSEAAKTAAEHEAIAFDF